MWEEQYTEMLKQGSVVTVGQINNCLLEGSYPTLVPAAQSSTWHGTTSSFSRPYRYSSVHFNIVQYSTIQYSTVQYRNPQNGHEKRERQIFIFQFSLTIVAIVQPFVAIVQRGRVSSKASRWLLHESTTGNRLSTKFDASIEDWYINRTNWNTLSKRGLLLWLWLWAMGGWGFREKKPVRQHHSSIKVERLLNVFYFWFIGMVIMHIFLCF